MIGCGSTRTKLLQRATEQNQLELTTKVLEQDNRVA